MSRRQRALVRNAADPKQVRRAERVEKDEEALRAARLQFVLSDPLGRAAMWDLLDSAGVFRSIYVESARIHYNAGRQDFGHELIERLIGADEAGYLAMEAEARQRIRRANQQQMETDAAPGGEDA